MLLDVSAQCDTGRWSLVPLFQRSCTLALSSDVWPFLDQFLGLVCECLCLPRVKPESLRLEGISVENANLSNLLQSSDSLVTPE